MLRDYEDIEDDFDFNDEDSRTEGLSMDEIEDLHEKHSFELSQYEMLCASYCY